MLLTVRVFNVRIVWLDGGDGLGPLMGSPVPGTPEKPVMGASFK
jgi:hypothetical protein